MYPMEQKEVLEFNVGGIVYLIRVQRWCCVAVYQETLHVSDD